MSEAEGAEREALDEYVSELRHLMRNRFAAVRNAAFYLRRKTSKTELWEQDPRMQSFFDLIDAELEAADVALTKVLTREAIQRALAGEKES